jgi:hypothetical protein
VAPLNDLTGKVFGRITVIESTDKRYDRKVVWRCVCKCGKFCFIGTSQLTSGNTKSCGCLRIEKAGQYKKLNLIGKRFGSWTAIEGDIKRKGGKRIFWKCICDCGTERLVSTEDLMSGHSKSCGCSIGIPRGSHGLSYDKLYKTWSGMVQRCENENSASWKYYGGKGVVVCKEWRLSFKCFWEWANNNGYEDGLTIDRLDNNGNYEPLNCRWVTIKENNRNKGCIKKLTINGDTKKLVEWCELFNVNPSTVYRRLKEGWTEIDALLKPIKKKKL